MLTLALSSCHLDIESHNAIQVSSANVQRLRNKMKCLDVINYFLGENTHILCLHLFIWGFTSLSTLYRSYHDG